MESKGKEKNSKKGSISPEVMYFAWIQDGLKNLTESMSKMKLSIDTLLEREQEQKRNYPAINAQLHIIQERLRLIEENNNYQPMQYKPPVRSNPRDILRRKSLGKIGIFETDELSGTETVHRECLMENLESMVKNFDITNNCLLDDLLVEECLTQDEASTIRERSDRKDQVRKLIVNIARRGKGKFVKFLATIKKTEYYPYIAKCIQDSYEKKTSQELSKECLLCAIKRDVDIKDAIDKLCKHKLVDFDFLDLVVANSSLKGNSQSHLWEVVFTNIDNAPNRIDAVRILQECLTIKHENLSAKLGQSKFKQFSNHQCLSRTLQFPLDMPAHGFSWKTFHGSTSSLDDRSTTSERPKTDTNKEDDERLPLQEPGVTSTTDTTDGLPLTVAWVMKVNSNQTSDSDISPTTSTVPHGNNFPPIREENDISPSSKKSRSDNIEHDDPLSSVCISMTERTSSQEFQSSQFDIRVLENTFSAFNPFSLQENKENNGRKKKVLRKRREQKLKSKMQIDIGQANVNTVKESKETQTPDVDIEQRDLSFGMIKTNLVENEEAHSNNGYDNQENGELNFSLATQIDRTRSNNDSEETEINSIGYELNTFNHENDNNSCSLDNEQNTKKGKTLM